MQGTFSAIRNAWAAPFLHGLVAVAVALVAVRSLFRLEDQKTRLEEFHGANLALASHLHFYAQAQSSATRGFLLTSDSSFLMENQRAGEQLWNTLDTLIGNRPSSKGAELAMWVGRAQTGYTTAFQAGLDSGINRAGKKSKADFFLHKLAPHKGELDSSTRALLAYQSRSYVEAGHTTAKAVLESVLVVAATCGLGLLLAAGLAITLNRRLGRAEIQRDHYRSRLKAQDALMTTITEQAARALFFQDKTFQCTYMNAAAERMTGYALVEVLGKSLDEVLHPSMPGGFRNQPREESVSYSCEDGKRREGKTLIRRKDGTDLPITFTLSPLAQDRECGGVMLEAEDITERLRAEETLRVSDERFHALSKATNDTVYDLNVRTGILWWSEAMESLFGYTPDKAGYDQTWKMSRIHPRDRDRMHGVYQAVFESSSFPLREEYRFKCMDGSFKVVQERGFLIHDAEGKGVRMIGAMMDVTAQKAAEEELRRFRILAEGSHDFIVMANLDGIPTFLNAEGQKLAGLDSSPAFNSQENIFQYVFEEDREEAKRIWTMAEKAGQWTGEFRLFHRASGSAIPVSWNIFVLKEPGNPEVIAMAAVGRDLTALREKEEQLRQSQKLEVIGKLAGGIAHDFNNILTVINGYTELLLEKTPSSDPNRELLQVMMDSGNRAATLTAQMLAFGRRQVLQPRILDLNQSMEETARMLRRVIGEAIELRLNPDPNLGKIKADPVQINQMLLNLCLNARDAMAGKGGILSLETSGIYLREGMHGKFGNLPPGPYASLAVTDTGTGMPRKVQEHLFEPFFTTKEPGKGTGLGLSSVYGIIRQSGGGVEVTSHVGRGSRFRVYFPSLSAVDRNPNQVPEIEVQSIGSGGTILLVEDEDPVRKITRRLLENSGYTVLDAKEGGEALTLLERTDVPPDLILTDVVMPGMGGRELAEAVHKRYPNQKILFMTGYSEEVLPNLVTGPVFHLLRKPFSSQSLIVAVQEAMHAYPAHGQV